MDETKTSLETANTGLKVDKDLVQSDEIRLYYKDLISELEAGRYTRQPLN